MALSLAKAAEAAGVSRTTLRRAIHSGRLSATRLEDGSYEVEPSELARVFPRPADSSAPAARHGEANDTGALRVENELLRERLADKDAVIDDLRRRLDAEAEERRQLTLLLTGPEKRRWWWWRGK